jgi:hypothetical protein
MVGPGELDHTLTYDYDGSPFDGPPIIPRLPDGVPGRGQWRWPRWSRPQGRRRRRGGQRGPGLRLEWPHPGRRFGDFLVFLTAADSALIGSRHERHRYATVGLLMLITAAQAVYAATLFFSVSLGTPFGDEVYYGVFFAAAVLLIDRSIIGYAPAIKVKRGELRPPKRTNGMLAIRIIISVAAAMLMSEMILLQVFAGDIREQIQNDHLAITQTTNNAIEDNYQARIKTLQTQITNAQNTVNADNQTVSKAYQAMNCQEFGCPGITGGIGPGYAAAKANWQTDSQLLDNAKAQLQNIRATNLPQINQLAKEEQQAIAAAQPAISNADKVLSQEQAFWQLTVANGTVLAVRVLLSVLILGIDLAPVLYKLTGRTSIHDIRAHANDYDLLEQHRHNVELSVYQRAEDAKRDRLKYGLAMETELFQAQQQAGVAQNAIHQQAGVDQNGAQRQAEVGRERDDANAEVACYRIGLWARLEKLKEDHHYDRQERRYTGGNPPPGQAPPGVPPDSNGKGPHDPAGRRASRDDGYVLVSPLSAPPAPGAARDVRVEGAPAERDTDPPLVVPADHEAQDPRGPDVPAPRPPAPASPEPAADDIPPAPQEEDDSPPAVPEKIWERPDILWRRGDQTRGHMVLNDRYVLYRHLPGADDGGGGIVWEAGDRLDGMQQRLVVKTVPRSRVNRERLRMLLREQRVKGISNEHIGRILDTGDDRGFFYLVYPQYRPGSLAKYCQRPGVQLRLPWCAQMIHEVLAGLMAASEFGLVHLDLKPGNIVLDGEHARVIDWGLSRRLDANHPSTWVVRGTPFFACPEQLIDTRIGWETHRADLFGLGATFFWLLTGEAPLRYEAELAGGGYDLETYITLLKRRAQPQPVDRLVTGVPKQLGELIGRWMSRDPARRVPPGTSMNGSLRAARDELEALMPILPDMIVGRVTTRKRRRPR